MIATTATEAALYDEVVGGQLRYWMGSLTAKNLPLSMFLETPDLGYPAWSGPTNKNVSNSDIKSSLGLGIVRFEEQPEEPEISTYDYEYRTNTEVITAVEVSGGQSDPDDPVTVQFHIDGTTYPAHLEELDAHVPHLGKKVAKETNKLAVDPVDKLIHQPAKEKVQYKHLVVSPLCVRGTVPALDAYSCSKAQGPWLGTAPACIRFLFS